MLLSPGKVRVPLKGVEALSILIFFKR